MRVGCWPFCFGLNNNKKSIHGKTDKNEARIYSIERKLLKNIGEAAKQPHNVDPKKSPFSTKTPGQQLPDNVSLFEQLYTIIDGLNRFKGIMTPQDIHAFDLISSPSHLMQMPGDQIKAEIVKWKEKQSEFNQTFQERLAALRDQVPIILEPQQSAVNAWLNQMASLNAPGPNDILLLTRLESMNNPVFNALHQLNPFMNKQQNNYVSLNVKLMAKSDLDFNHFCEECTIIFHQLHREFLDRLSKLKKNSIPFFIDCSKTIAFLNDIEKKVDHGIYLSNQLLRFERLSSPMFRQSYYLEHCLGGFNNKKRVPIDDIMRMSHQEFLAYEGQFEHKLKANKIEFEARIDRLRSQTFLISTAERPMFVERIGTIDVKLKNSEIEDAPNGLPMLLYLESQVTMALHAIIRHEIDEIRRFIAFFSSNHGADDKLPTIIANLNKCMTKMPLNIGTIVYQLQVIANVQHDLLTNSGTSLQDRFSTHRYTTPKFKDENYPKPEVMLCIVLNQLHNQRKQIGFRCEIHGHL